MRGGVGQCTHEKLKYCESDAKRTRSPLFDVAMCHSVEKLSKRTVRKAKCRDVISFAAEKREVVKSATGDGEVQKISRLQWQTKT